MESSNLKKKTGNNPKPKHFHTPVRVKMFKSDIKNLAFYLIFQKVIYRVNSFKILKICIVTNLYFE